MKRFIIIDGNALVHRAYHALPRLTTKKGELVNAVYGFLLVFLKAIREFEPAYVVACFDLPAPTFRHKKFAEYKITRPKAPDELYEQIPKVKEVLKAFSVPIFEKEGFEADDLIGTIAKKVSLPTSGVGELPTSGVGGLETIVLSGDLDTLQVVDKNTKVYTLKRGVKETILYDENKFFERYQFSPSLFPDFKALKGDPSDNIPGVPGVGEKTAIELVKKFGSLENLYKKIEEKGEKAREIKPKIREILEKSKKQAFFSKMLAQLRYDVPIDFDLAKCDFGKYDKEKVASAFKELEFYTLMERLPSSDKSSSKQEKLF